MSTVGLQRSSGQDLPTKWPFIWSGLSQATEQNPRAGALGNEVNVCSPRWDRLFPEELLMQLEALVEMEWAVLWEEVAGGVVGHGGGGGLNGSGAGQ